MRYLAIIFIFFLAISCIKNTTPVNKNVQPVFYSQQVPGCFHAPLKKSAIAAESCFSYSFKDTLKLQFCLPGNCCPDSDRFDYSYHLINDTLKYTVVDTAKNLCRCMCTYQIFSQVSALTEDNYIFVCLYDDSIYYAEKIQRGK